MNTAYPGLKILLLYLILVLFVGLLLSIIDFVQNKYRFTLKNLMILWWIHIIDWGLRILVYILAAPLILLLFLLQPVLFLAFLIAIILIGIYGIGLLYEQPIVANPPTSREALWGLLTIVGCISIWLLATKVFKSENALYQRYADFYVRRVQQPVQQSAERLMQRMDT